MSMVVYAAVGAVAGLIVSSSQGFSDPPWEGFLFHKFVRSILVGTVVGAVFWWAQTTGRLLVDDIGVMAFGVIAIERVAGETYKGFLRPGRHPEYEKLLRRLHVPVRWYVLQLVMGAGFFAVALWLFHELARGLAFLMAQSGDRLIPGLLVGIAAGLLVAAGGALKDSQMEGFLPLKFIRSPIVGALTGIFFIYFSSSPLLVTLAAMGGERVCVESYKTFVARQVRGIHANQPPRYPHWIKWRFVVFGIPYAASVVVAALLLGVHGY